VSADELDAIEARTVIGMDVPALIAALREAWAEVERLRDEAASGPSWDAVALRSALVAMTVERDDLRAAHERLTDEVTAVKAQRDDERRLSREYAAAIARVRALCDEAGSLAFTGVTEGGWLHYEAVEAALDGEAPDPEDDGNHCCTPDSGDCCGPGSWCCSRAGKHDHPVEA
jgi:hypothetical protein